MCGILGHLAFTPQERLPREKVSALNDLMIRRGPDSGGLFLKDNVALAMRRLAIVDLGGGDQPMSTADGRYTIIFNGEVYNHDELRADLLARSVYFRTRSDTEVLLQHFIAHGPRGLTQLNGMFAFAVWDDLEKKLFLARDRMGVKPLYYRSDGKRFLFASELTPLCRSGLFDLEIDSQSIADYLAYWYVCEPRTLIRGVLQLPPGHYAWIGEGGGTAVHSWWTIPVAPETPMKLEEAAERFRDLFDDAIRIRMKVDVPFGTFLSGGIDSGLVTAFATRHASQRLSSFGIGFKEKSYDELALAQQTARRLDVDLHMMVLDQIDAAAIDEVLTAFDEPLGNASSIPTYFLSRLASRQVKVVLTGDGADELFGGYPTYQAPYYRRLYESVPGFLRAWGERGVASLPVSHRRISLDYRLRQFIRGVKLPPAEAHYTWREVSSAELRKDLFQDGLQDVFRDHHPFSVMAEAYAACPLLDEKNRFMYVDQRTYLLNDHLRKSDRMSMANSLEAREPFLDYRIVEFAAAMPSDLKVTFFQTKRFLKHIARGVLPPPVIRGKKKGLTSPIAGWLSNELRDYLHDQLRGGLVEQFFRREVLEQLLEAHFRKTADHSRLLWGILALQVWHRHLVSSPSPLPVRIAV